MKAPAPALELARWIVWEDDGLLAVNKPAGVLSQGGEGGAGVNVVDLARSHLGHTQVGVLHRLDRNVSGLVLISKNARAARAMSALFAAGEVTRIYQAVVRGRPPAEAFAVDAWLAKDPVRNEVRAATAEALATLPDAERRAYRPAHTEAELIRTFRTALGACAVLEVRPITGRSHQLRVHLAHIGCPIIGDPKYGVAAHGVNRPLLHAARIEFIHPRSRASVVLEAPVPWTEPQLRALRPVQASAAAERRPVRPRSPRRRR